MKRQDLRNRHPFHNPRLATLRWQLRFYIIAAVLDVLAIGCLISAAILFCLESKS